LVYGQRSLAHASVTALARDGSDQDEIHDPVQEAVIWCTFGSRSRHLLLEFHVREVRADFLLIDMDSQVARAVACESDRLWRFRVSVRPRPPLPSHLSGREPRRFHVNQGDCVC
jgi:hypothetical protein